MYEPDHRLENGGAPLGTDARGHLIRSHEAFIKETGFRMKSGCEPEMTWFGDKLEVQVRPGASPAYHMGNLELMRPIYKRVMEYAISMGLDMIEGDYEDPGQLELNWMFDSCELTADRLMTYRLICRQVASEFGVKASFMPKPSTGSMGNGCHHNVSLWKDDRNVLAEPGRRELHLTDVRPACLGWHARSRAWLHDDHGVDRELLQTLLGYRPIRSNSNQLGHGQQNLHRAPVGQRSSGVQAPRCQREPVPLAHRASRRHAGRLRNKTSPGPSESKDSYVDGGESVGIPLTLGDAVAAFDRDDVVRSAFPAELSSSTVN
jgi:glutamine synthetase